MSAECCSRRADRKRVAKTASWSLLPGLLLALAPKCPLCLAAYLSVFGLGAGAAAVVAPWLRPVAIVLLIAVALATARVWYRRRAALARRYGAG